MGLPGQPSSASPWIVKLSTSRKMPYYLNADTHESRWEAPTGLTTDQIMALPGARDYLDPNGNPREVPGQVRASHLLVKHSGSRNPRSWKEERVTRSKAEAIQILKGYAAEINGSYQKFCELATIHSDCSSHSKAGDLGWFSMGQMQKPFEDATMALNVGEMSDVVDTDSGVHLIWRLG